MRKIVVVVAGVFALMLGSCSADKGVENVGDGRGWPVFAEITNLRETPSKIFCTCNNITGRDLVFDLTVTNEEEETQAVFAFIWFTTTSISPAERAVWPAAAVESCVTADGELMVTDPKRGERIEVPGKGSCTKRGNAVLQPIVYKVGKPVSFEQLRVELWTQAGNRIYDETFGLE